MLASTPVWLERPGGARRGHDRQQLVRLQMGKVQGAQEGGDDGALRMQKWWVGVR